MRPAVSSNSQALSGLLFLPWLAGAGAAFYLLRAFPPSAADPEHEPSAARVRVEIQLKAPSAFSRLKTSPGSPLEVRFQWGLSGMEKGPSGSGALQRLEFCENPNFTREKTRSVRIESVAAREIVERLGAGHYFWRLRVGSEGPSETRELWIEEERPAASPVPSVSAPVAVAVAPPPPPPRSVPENITLVAPARGQEFFDAGGGAPSFSWRGRALIRQEGRYYQLEISPDRAFGQLMSRKSRRNFITDRDLNLSPGTYFWRVRLLDSSGTTLALSRVSYFTQQQSPLPLPPPSKVRVAPDRSGAEAPESGK